MCHNVLKHHKKNTQNHVLKHLKQVDLKHVLIQENRNNDTCKKIIYDTCIKSFITKQVLKTIVLKHHHAVWRDAAASL